MANATTETKPVRGYKGMAMEGVIATWYAQNTRSRIEEQRQLAVEIAGSSPKGGHVLEVSPGPGYLSVELAKLGAVRVSALDISATFVRIVRENAAEAGVSIDVRQGDAAYIPYPDNTFDFIVNVAAFKNFTQPVRAISEFHRVLKPGGAALIADLRGDATMEDINAEVDRMGLNWINATFTRLAFRTMLLKNAYTRAQFESMAAQTPFKRCKIETETIGLRVWLNKQP